MPKIEVTRQHTLPREEAKRRVGQLIEKLQQKLGLKSSWVNDCLEFSGTGVKGQVLLQEAQISIRVELSMMLAMLKSKVEEQIGKQLDKELQNE